MDAIDIVKLALERTAEHYGVCGSDAAYETFLMLNRVVEEIDRIQQAQR